MGAIAGWLAIRLCSLELHWRISVGEAAGTLWWKFDKAVSALKTYSRKQKYFHTQTLIFKSYKSKEYCFYVFSQSVFLF